MHPRCFLLRDALSSSMSGRATALPEHSCLGRAHVACSGAVICYISCCRQVPALLGQLGRGWLPLASAAAEALMAVTVAVEGKQAVVRQCTLHP